MTNVKEQIIDWFNSSQNYAEGLKLLADASNKRKLIKKLNYRGETITSRAKLLYELNKFAGLKKIPAPSAEKMGINRKVSNKGIKPGKKGGKTEGEISNFNLIGKNDISTYPGIIQSLVKEYSSKYMLRGKKHAALKRLGDGNDQETIDARKEIINEIQSIANRMEVLFVAFKAYKDGGKLFDPDVMWPKKDDEKKPAADVAPKTIEELKIMKKNLQSSITKDRNLLQYGEKTKSETGKENPIPAGPKRTIIEKRVAKKEKEILAIDTRIAELV